MKKVSLIFHEINLDTSIPNCLRSVQRVYGRTKKHRAPAVSAKTFSFNLRVGPHAALWKVEGDRNKQTITLSGDVSRTFFGHDLLISRNEHEQMTALVKILRAALDTVTGLEMPPNNIVLVDEVTIIRHFTIGDIEAQREAMHKLYRNLVARCWGDVYKEGETISSPGIITVKIRGLGEVIRIHSAADLMNPLPEIDDYVESETLFHAYDHHLRFEFNVGQKLLQEYGLNSTVNWFFDLSTNDYLEQIFKSFGLSSHCRADIAGLPNGAEVTGHGADEANALIDAWRKGEHVFCHRDVRGSPFRMAKKFLSDAGFDIQIKAEDHHWVSHGRHDLLQPAASALFSRELRENANIFDRWWERDKAVAAIRDYGIRTF